MKKGMRKSIALLSVAALCLGGCNSKKNALENTETTTIETSTEQTSEQTTTEGITTEATTKENTTQMTTTEEASTTEATTEVTTEASTEATSEEPVTEENSAGSEAYPEAEDFVLVSDMIPEAVLEIRYYTDYNFVGERIDGYEEPVALLTKEAASALKEVNDDLMEQGYKIKIYDAYRPQQAVDNFVSWAEDVNDTKMKADFYPEVDKSLLFDQGYIGRHSGHSRGSTVDLTLVDKDTGFDVDMGGTFDYFGEKSHPDYSGVTDVQYEHRMILRNAMTAHGFRPLDTEWWHFTLENEPYPDTYFSFPVNSKSVGE